MSESKVYVHSIGATKGPPQVVLRFRGTREEQEAACREWAACYADSKLLIVHNLLSQRDELAGALEACSMLDLDDGLCWCGDWATHHERQSDACKRARAALAHVKAGT